MARVTVIVDDNLVIVNGKPHTIDCSAFPAIHAIQWFGQNGEIEFKPTLEGQPPNQAFTDVTPFQSLIDAWQFAEDHPPPPPPPTPEELRAQEFVADTQRAVVVERLKNATPDQIRTFVNNNVTDLASAKTMMANLAVAVALAVRR